VAAMARLERVVANLDGTLERRAVGAVMAARGRGGRLSAAVGAKS